MRVHRLASVLFFLVAQGVAQASERLEWSLVRDDDGARARVPLSATPFDPTSLPHDRFFGRDSYSSRTVAIELVLNAIQVRYTDSLIYRPRLDSGYRVHSRWRFRMNESLATVRYEICF